MSKLRLREFVPYQLQIAANAVSKVIASAYAERFNLSIPEWRLIAVLYEASEATQQDLVRATLMDKVTVSRTAQTLEQRKLVTRRLDANDGRVRRLRLTDQGEQVYNRIAPAALEYERRLLAFFDQKEIASLNVMLTRLTNAASELAEETADAAAERNSGVAGNAAHD